MKPHNWDTMSKDSKKEVALGMLKSMRGAYIISQALFVAKGEMEKVTGAWREQSNIEDMEILMESLFDIYPAYDAAKTAWSKDKGMVVKE